MRFDSYHPAIQLLFFVGATAAAVTFDQPVFLLISYLCPFLYSIVLNGKRAAVFNLLLIPLMVLYMVIYASYNHFGITNLRSNFIGNQITLESLVYGMVIAGKAASFLMWFSCIHAVVTSDKVVYLFGRISPKLSLFLSILLRMVPRIRDYARKVHTAQQCIGRGLGQGSILRRLRNFFRIVSIVFTWTIENFIRTADSMRSRGYGLRGRTAFSIYRFDGRDRSLVLGMSACFTVVLMGMLLDQTDALYDPRIIVNRITPASAVFYTAYGCVCLLPMMLQLAGEYRFSRMREAGN